MWKIQSRLQLIRSEKSLDRDAAGKLRGDINWLWSMCAGHVGKLAGPILTEKQSGTVPLLTPLQMWTLNLLVEITVQADPRDVYVTGHTKEPVVVYSDASFEQVNFGLAGYSFIPSCLPLVVVARSQHRSWLHGHHDVNRFTLVKLCVASLSLFYTPNIFAVRILFGLWIMKRLLHLWSEELPGRLTST